MIRAVAATTAAVVSLALCACPPAPQGGAAPSSPAGGASTGSVAIKLTDAPFDAEKIEVTLSEVAVHFVPDGKAIEAVGDDMAAVTGPENPGWHDVLGGEKTVDLLVVAKDPAALGNVALGAGKVTQIRLVLSEATPPTITIGGEAKPLTVSSGKVKVVGNFDVVPGQTTEIMLDFDAEASIKQQGDGYQMKPTIKLVKDGAAGDADAEAPAEDATAKPGGGKAKH